uniref:Uncharacterized protein n=1 Tax=Tetranychus urticae TaxID=32264 RepID=T1JQZ5_TETUR
MDSFTLCITIPVFTQHSTSPLTTTYVSSSLPIWPFRQKKELTKGTLNGCQARNCVYQIGTFIFHT